MPRWLLKLRPRKGLRGLAGAMPPPHRSLDVEPLLHYTTLLPLDISLRFGKIELMR